MTYKQLPFSQQQVAAIAARYPTPLYLYDEAGIRASARALRLAFAWADFAEFFAVKATPNPFILKLLRAEGLGADCSSLPELLLAEQAGILGEAIMFTSNDTPAEEFRAACRLGAIVNLDDLSHLGYLAQHAGVPELISFRYNPGALRTGNAIIGRPEEAKFGLTREQMFAAYHQAREQGARRFGLHAMVASNELDARYFIETAAMLFDLAAEIADQVGVRFEFVNLGGGIGIPYRPEQHPVDLQTVSDGIRAAYAKKIAARGLAPLKIFMECGRLITGPHGYLVSTVRHLKRTHKQFVGTDASMANLMRPGMYGAYHHATVLGKEHLAPTEVYDVTGSLCENNDKFAVDRPLPAVEVGDRLVFHDAGAHGHAMGFNYNGKLRSAELLLRENGEVLPIRRAETIEDYFATLPLDGLEAFVV
jgi:diaminopimelate decarboxylase